MERPPDNKSARRAAVLCNPDAGRVRGCLDQVRTAAARIPGCLYREADDLDSMRAALAEFRSEQVSVIITIGGDGTLHAVLSECLRSSAPTDVPALVPIPGGTTNMNATDLGITGRPDAVLGRLRQLFSNPLYPPRVSRPVLSIRSPGDETRHGMFLGAGIIADGVKHFSTRVRGRGVTGEMASGWVVMRYVALLLAGRVPDTLPLRLRTHEDGEVQPDSDSLLFLATTLDRLLLGARPYWGDGSGPMRYSRIDYPPGKLWSALPALYRGDAETLRSIPGYHSRRLRHLEVAMDGEYVIDGEIYAATRERGPLIISATEPLIFLSP